MNIKNFPKWFDNLLDAIQSVLMSFLVKLGPFFVALMPALFTAYAIFHMFKVDAGPKIALLFALVVGASFETVGIVACHTALDLYNAMEAKLIQPVKFWLMVALIPVYIIGVASVVGFSQDAFTPLVKGLGIVSPFLTTIVYVAVALAMDISRIEARQEIIEDKQAQIEAEERAWQREKERMELEQKHAEKLARIEAKRAVEASKSSKLDVMNAARQAEKERALNAVLTFVATNPNASLNEIGRAVGKTKSTAGNYVNELIDIGRLVKNGHGWEVSQ